MAHFAAQARRAASPSDGGSSPSAEKKAMSTSGSLLRRIGGWKSLARRPLKGRVGLEPEDESGGRIQVLVDQRRPTVESQSPTNSATSARAVSSSQPACHPWSARERAAYVARLSLANETEEEWLLHFLGDALASSPLPAPWEMHRAKKCNQVFFSNKTTGESSWTHPLEHLLQDLAGTARMCMALPLELRKSCVLSLCETWEAEAHRQLSSWYPAEHEDAVYYCCGETHETMWEHPVEVFGPNHFVKIKSAKLLCDEEYVVSLQTRELAPGGKEMWNTVTTSTTFATTAATTAGTFASGRPSTVATMASGFPSAGPSAGDSLAGAARSRPGLGELRDVDPPLLGPRAAAEAEGPGSPQGPAGCMPALRAGFGEAEAFPGPGPEHFELSPGNSPANSAGGGAFEDLRDLEADVERALAEEAWLGVPGACGGAEPDSPTILRPDSDVAAYERAAEALLNAEP